MMASTEQAATNGHATTDSGKRHAAGAAALSSATSACRIKRTATVAGDGVPALLGAELSETSAVLCVLAAEAAHGGTPAGAVVGPLEKCAQKPGPCREPSDVRARSIVPE